MTRRDDLDDAALRELYDREEAESAAYWARSGATYFPTSFESWKAARETRRREAEEDELRRAELELARHKLADLERDTAAPSQPPTTKAVPVEREKVARAAELITEHRARGETEYLRDVARAMDTLPSHLSRHNVTRVDQLMGEGLIRWDTRSGLYVHPRITTADGRVILRMP